MIRMKETANRNKSFLVEAGIISVSSFVVKIVGVLFKIPLAVMLGSNMGIFTAAYSLYAMLYMISTSGLPVAISRMIAASDQRGRGREVQRIFRISLLAFTAIGLFVTILMVVFAGPFFRATGHPDSVLAAYWIAPTLLFVCVCSAFRGYYQGLHNMYPTAIGQLIEAVFKMGLGLGATAWAAHRGYAPHVQAACAISGITVGMMVEMLLLFAYRARTRARSPQGTDLRVAPTSVLTKRILMIALPATITSSALYLSNFIDTMLIKKCLMIGGELADRAEALYSAYTSYASAIADLFPSTLVYPIAISVLPAVSAAFSVRDIRSANCKIVQSIRISAIIGMPCAAFLVATAPSCLTLLYSGAFETYTSVDALAVSSGSLRILAVGIIFMSIVSTTNALLQAVGKIWLPMLSVGVGVVCMALIEYFGISGILGIYGAPISSVCCYLLAATLNLMFLRVHTTAPLSTVRLFVKPAICSVLTGCTTYVAYFLLRIPFSGTTRVQSFVVLCLCAVVAVATYVFSMLLICGIKASEVRLLPMGNRLASYLIRKGWLYDGKHSN